MKLKEFNSENTIAPTGACVRLPAIGLNLKGGLFNINRSACDLMGLKAGDQVVIHQDEDDQASWYLEKVKSKGFSVREKTSLGKGLFFNNRVIAQSIADSVGFKGSGGRLLVAGKPTDFEKRKLWGLITASLKNK